MTEKSRFRTLWPLPGGSGAYLRSLRWIVENSKNSCTVAELQTSLVRRFDLKGHRTSISYLRVVHSLGLIEIVGKSIYLTPTGIAFLNSEDPGIIRQALLDRIEGCDLMLDILADRPLRISVLLLKLNEAGKYSWATQAQVRYRLRWLEEVGEIVRIGKGQPEYGLAVERQS